MDRLYYFEIEGDKFIGEANYDTPMICLSLCNAKFFSTKKSAKIWHDKYCGEFQDAVLISFELTNWQREE